MSSFLFFSPPQPPVQHFDNLLSISSFTPQAHRSSPFAFAPRRPSPLITSKNVNIMNTRDDKLENVSGQGESPIKPLEQEDTSDTASYANVPAAAERDGFPAETLAISTAQFLPSSTFAPSIMPDLTSLSSLEQTQRASQFQVRARQASPAVQLSGRLRDERENRKRIFFDRLRNKRDNARDERGEQQILRREYLRQKQSWEDLKHREGAQHFEPNDMDLELEFQMEEEIEDEMSPPEDRELEDLAELYVVQHSVGQGISVQALHEQDFLMEDDDEYDEAFTEMLKQQGDTSSPWQQHETNTAGDNSGYDHFDTSMDSEMS